MDQRAEWHGLYRIHRTLPASLVTETAEASILIGLEGRGKIGLSYRFGHLPVDVHAFYAPFRHAPHRQVCRTEAPRTSSAGSRCPCAVSARRTGAIPRPLLPRPQSSGRRSSPPARALMRSLLAAPSRPGQRRTRHPFNPLSEQKAVRSLHIDRVTEKNRKKWKLLTGKKGR